jgi:hypothetical protein
VKNAHARAAGQRSEIRRFLALLNDSAKLGDLGCLPLGERRLAGLAALAGAEAGALGGGDARMKRDVSGRGGRAAQEGRQYTPVVLTE